MTKKTQNFTQLSVGFLVCMVVSIALFFYSCKKKEMPVATSPIYRITFDSKDGTMISPVMVKSDNTITLPASPTKTGFIFDGWYTDSQASITPFLASTAITANLTLYAKWNAVTPTVFSLSSTSFTDGEEIPLKYTYQDYGQIAHLDVSPQLSWTNAPAETTSYLIIMENNTKEYPNWRVFNISANITSLTENDPLLPIGAYIGPWAAKGETHTYQITIFALDLPENYFNYNKNSKYPPITEEEVYRRLSNHILASASITGTFTGK